MVLRLRLFGRHMLIVLIALMGIIAVSAYELSAMRQNMIQDAKVKARHTVEVVVSLLSYFASMERNGALSREDAQARAILAIRSLRYDRKDYFWINDFEPRMVMHPYRSDLDGRDLAEFEDAEGNRLFSQAVALVKQGGAGYISYLWPLPGENVPQSKISYVAGFEQWEWIVGSGVYLDTINHIFFKRIVTIGVVVLCIIIGVVAAVSYVSIGITRPLAMIKDRMLRLADGDHGIDVPMTDRVDEIGDLTRAMQVFKTNTIAMEAFRDEREKMRADSESALRESEQRFRDLADLLPETVFETNAEGILTYLNRAGFEVSGLSEEDFNQGVHMLDFIVPEERSLAQCSLSAVMQGNVSSGHDYTFLRRDGSLFPALARTAPIMQNGHFVGMRGFIFNISKLKETEEALVKARDELELRVVERTRELEKEVTERRYIEKALQEANDTLEERVRERTRALEHEIEEREAIENRLREARDEAQIANKAKTEFLANMSHELRTPLNSIIGFSDVLVAEMFGAIENERYRDYVRDINTSGKHLLELINDILDLSSIESGGLRLRETRVDIARMLSSCRRLMKEPASEGGVGLEIKSDDALPALMGDERRIRQIVLNLLANAVKFTPSGGNVVLSAHVIDDGSVEIAVSDTGIGISQDDLEIVMSPFGQADGSLSRSYEGTGLGLPLSRRLAALHNATLEIESEVGEGTVVTVRFPPERAVRLG